MMRRDRPAATAVVVALLLALSAGSAAARCGGADTPLAALALADAPPAGPVTVEAVVSAVFAGEDALNGFYVAEPGPGGEPVGLFVYAPELAPAQLRRLAPGAMVRMQGRAGRYSGQRQLERLSALRFCGTGSVPEPVALRLPAAEARLRRLDGVLVRIEQPLTVTDNYDLGRYGSVQLIPGQRLYAEPGAGTGGFRLILDDGSHVVGPEPVPYLDADGTRRLGSRLAGLSGVLAGTFGEYRIHPVAPPRWQDANPRRKPEPPAGGVLRLALLNVQNYFHRLGARGAASADQRRLQRTKLAAAVALVEADILAMLEVGNSARAVRSLRDAFNGRMPPGQGYRSARPPGPVGDDAIRAVLLYRPDRLELHGEAGVHEDARFERPPLWARFRRPGGSSLTVVAAHLKSKGGCPAGQTARSGLVGCWAERRASQARGLGALLRRLPGNRELLLADLNAYPWEEPAALLREAGLVDLGRAHLPPRTRYTYVYRGYAGMLDYAFAGSGLASKVTDVQIWHLNADEPRFLGYRGRYPEAAAAAGAYRSSDHDMVIVDLEELP